MKRQPCGYCYDTGWVCETHFWREFEKCVCGGAGKPCRCNKVNPPWDYGKEERMNLEDKLKINRVWAMPNRWTFQIKPIKELLNRYMKKDEFWVDSFAGYNSPAQTTNDLDPKAPVGYHDDALRFLQNWKKESYDGGLYDPPYSITQARMYGKKEYASMKYWAECKNELARIIKPNGIVICCGWNSNGLGKNRGYKLLEILLVSHGGSKNDTIITVEQKRSYLNEP
jgi:hypothetical protein